MPRQAIELLNGGKQVMEQGGYSEQLAAVWLAEGERKRKAHTDPPNRSELTDQIPYCPQCSNAMVLRMVKSCKNDDKQFWGSSVYPNCKGLVEL